MIEVLPSSERGHENFGWLDSHHTFSFGEYFNPRRMGFRALKAINEDRIAGGNGFPSHTQKDMEIVSLVIEGALRHKDTLGNESLLYPGEMQILSSGTGLRMSEANGLADQDTHVLQLWISPDRKNYPPSYQKKSFTQDFETKSLVLMVSPDGEDGSLSIHQDVWVHAGRFRAGEERYMPLDKGRHAWIQLLKGELKVNQVSLTSCDGFAMSDERELHLKSATDSDFLILDLA